jgi:colanic acid biosynthesis glycosyl transferase WcaI
MDSARTTAEYAVLVTQFYRPETIGSGPFCGDIAEALAAYGWRIRVLTSRPHYPDGAVFMPFRTGALDHQRIGGVEVDRLPTLVSANKGTLHRMAGEASFLLRGLAALATGRVKRAEVVISLCPSILSVILGSAFRRPNARHIAIVHDIQSGLAEGLGMARGPVPAVLRTLERFALNQCDLVVVLSEDMRRQLEHSGVRTPILVLPIWSDTEAIQPQPIPPGPARMALYSGNFGRKQGLMQVVEMAAVLARRKSELRIVLRGRGSQADIIERELKARDLRNVSLSDLIAADKLSDALAEGDIHLVPQDPSVADFAVPSKIYGIMAAGRPFIATARPDSTLWRLQRESNAFVCVAPNDPEGFADAILNLAENEGMRRELGNHGRQYVQSHCSKDKSLARLVAAIGSA